MDCSPPGPSVHGTSQARVLEWVAISYSRGSSGPRDRTCISCIGRQMFTAEPPVKNWKWSEMLVPQLCLILCDLMDCSTPSSSFRGILQARILEWLPFPSPGDLPDPGIECGSPALQADSLPSAWDGRQGSPNQSSRIGFMPKNLLKLVSDWITQVCFLLTRCSIHTSFPLTLDFILGLGRFEKAEMNLSKVKEQKRLAHVLACTCTWHS